MSSKPERCHRLACRVAPVRRQPPPKPTRSHNCDKHRSGTTNGPGPRTPRPAPRCSGRRTRRSAPRCHCARSTPADHYRRLPWEDAEPALLHAARDGQHHPFAAEVRRLLLALTNGRSYVCYSKPGSHDTEICTVKIATSSSIAIGMLASVTNLPTRTPKPPSSSVIMLTQAMKCGAGTPSTCRIAAKLSGPRAIFAKPCSTKPYPAIKGNGIGAHGATADRTRDRA